MSHTPQQLRREAEHCRELANSQFDERVRMILTGMADDFQRQAFDLEAAERVGGPRIVQPG